MGFLLLYIPRNALSGSKHSSFGNNTSRRGVTPDSLQTPGEDSGQELKQARVSVALMLAAEESSGFKELGSCEENTPDVWHVGQTHVISTHCL